MTMHDLETLDGPSLQDCLLDEACAIALLCKALGDSTRLQIMLILSRSSAGMCVYNLEQQFDLQQPTISHHLKVLRRAGLIDCERRGLWVYYYVRPLALEPLRKVVALLAQPA